MTMEPNPSVEAAGRGLRASVILATLAICVILFWGMKGLFQDGAGKESEPATARGSSFSAIDHGPASPQPSIRRSPQPGPEQATTTAISTTAATTAPVSPPDAPMPSDPLATTTALSATQTRSSGAGTDFGSLVGKVTLSGTPEPEKPLPLDPTCGRIYPSVKPTTQFYVVAPDGGLADVFVYITKGIENRNFLPPQQPLVLDQVGCVYTPYVAGALVGQTIEVRNSDPLLHNVHPTPAVAGNKEANKAHLPKAPPLLFNWNQPELFLRFKCDVHPWMFAYVSLVSHPYFAVTDNDGNYVIPDIPPGVYEFTFIHRKAGKFSQRFYIKPGRAVAINYNFELNQ
jgi:hypothetical protein